MKKKLSARVRRDCPIQVNLTPGERTDFDKRMKAAGARTRAEYLYKLILSDIAGVEKAS